jgi:hypothetical protein
MHIDAIEAVGPYGAMRAAGTIIRAEHEVVDYKLAAAIKQIGQTLFAVGSVENIILLDFHPRQAAALLTEFILKAREFLFFKKKPLSRLQPFGF